MSRIWLPGVGLTSVYWHLSGAGDPWGAVAGSSARAICVSAAQDITIKQIGSGIGPFILDSAFGEGTAIDNGLDFFNAP